MNVEKHIRHLLFEQNCVIIPEFGGFIANYISAAIHPIRHTFMPPSKHIAFNEMLKLNDGLLISHVATQEQVSREDAQKAVKEFVEMVKNEVKINKKYRFEDIGAIYSNHEQKLQFEPENTVNYLNASFGLPDMQYRPVERNAASRTSTRDNRNTATNDRFSIREEKIQTAPEEIFVSPSLSWSRRLQTAAIPVVMFMALFFGYFWFLDRGNTTVSKINPFPALDPDFFAKKNISSKSQPEKTENASLIPKNEIIENDSVKENTVEKPPVEDKTLQPEPVVVSKVRYYVIVGGFGSIANAQRLSNQLIAEGHRSSKVLPYEPNKLIKVSSGDYADEVSANEAAKSMQNQYPQAWVFKN
ncbi:MAG: HU-CCDC81 and SPOR domain-containing protein [Verrucomicrobia bacterium]|nr:HU-CCDC81 and SPOR domain-containing protein [Cytophagales bacterium]